MPMDKKEPAGKLWRTEFKAIGNAEGVFQEIRAGAKGWGWEEFAERIVVAPDAAGPSRSEERGLSCRAKRALETSGLTEGHQDDRNSG